jgi:hypothetical protein
MCLNEIDICVCLWERKIYILSLSLYLVKVGCYGFYLRVSRPQEQSLLLVGTEFDIPGEECKI